jgi:hypothetical protein
MLSTEYKRQENDAPVMEPWMKIRGAPKAMVSRERWDPFYGILSRTLWLG